ncbi:MAG TPA: ABC transporter substrate-binding protein [Aestuariivirgaceae bacterium]|jgi:phospholipid transport system substrate-binding protein
MMRENVSSSRRDVLRLLLFTGFAGILSTAAGGVLAAEHPAVRYIRKVTADLFAAHKLGTVSAFLPPIQRHADIETIANYSLGQYESRLSSSQRQRYYRGVANFMARYFADQTRHYRIAKWQVGDAEESSNGDILIDSRVTLMNGQSYSVVWRLARRGKGYKVTDVKVAGFSLTYFQRGLFVSFIRERKGDVNQLVAVLNR